MKTLIRRKIPRIYTAISRIDSSENRYYANNFFRTVQYKCLPCDTDFKVNHRFYNYGYLTKVNDTIIRCPVCGLRHYDSEALRHHTICSIEDCWVPTRIRMTVKELRDSVVLYVEADVQKITDARDYGSHISEEFKFDIKRRVSTFRQWHRKYKQNVVTHTLGAPIDNAIYGSVLWHLQPGTLASEYKKQAVEVTKTIREAICKKWTQIHGFTLKGLYTGFGSTNGYMLFPLKNFAYRLICPDAKNLPLWLSGNPGNTDAELDLRNFDSINVFTDMDPLRNAKNYLDAVIGYYKLPNTKQIRKLLQEDVFEVGVVAKLAKISSDPNNFMAVYNAVNRLCDLRDYRHKDFLTTRRPLINGLVAVAAGRKPSEIISYLQQNSAVSELRDTVSLLEDVTEDIRKKAKSIKLKRLHDWLAEQHSILEKKGFELEVPEHVVRRLQMQMDQAKFYLPHHSNELLKGSLVFHNCVKTYAKRVRKGACQIVYMTDDNGKLTACLEVCGDALVQAKLKYNKPVSEDSAVNDTVVDWCSKVGLRIKTSDVQERAYLVSTEAAV